MAPINNRPSNNELTVAGVLTLLTKEDWKSETDIDVKTDKGSKKLVSVQTDKAGAPERVTIHLKDGTDRHFVCLKRQAKAEDANYGLRISSWCEVDKAGKPIDNKIHFGAAGYSGGLKIKLTLEPVANELKKAGKKVSDLTKEERDAYTKKHKLTEEDWAAIATTNDGAPNPQMFVTPKFAAESMDAFKKLCADKGIKDVKPEAVCAGHSMGGQAMEFQHIRFQFEGIKSTIILFEEYAAQLAKKPMHPTQVAMLLGAGINPFGSVASIPATAAAGEAAKQKFAAPETGTSVRSKKPTEVSQLKPGGKAEDNKMAAQPNTVPVNPAKQFGVTVPGSEHFLKQEVEALANGAEVTPVEKPMKLQENGLPRAQPAPAPTPKTPDGMTPP